MHVYENDLWLYENDLNSEKSYHDSKYVSNKIKFCAFEHLNAHRKSYSINK
jgi:hypothetical protein